MTAKETVIFIHGLTGNHRAFKHMFKNNNNDYHYISYDLLGHGEDCGESVDFSIEALVKQLETIYDENNITSAHLCMLSYGCYVGIPFTRKHPEKVKSLCVIGGHYNNPSDLFSIFNKYNELNIDSYSKWLKTYVQDIFPKRDRLIDKASFLSKKIYVHFGLKLHPTVIKQSLAERIVYNLKEDLKHIKQPVLWCMGDQDTLYKSCLYDLHEVMPHVQYNEIKKAGHAANLFQPKRFESIFLSFLKKSIG
jgi:pimeloyl-ACP methyl ester carboxylesterase